jgi:hypothetical protein
MRPIKRMIYNGANGILYLISNVNLKKIEQQVEAQEEFANLMSHPDLANVPVLLLIENSEYNKDEILQNSSHYLNVAEAFKVTKTVQGMLFQNHFDQFLKS